MRRLLQIVRRATLLLLLSWLLLELCLQLAFPSLPQPLISRMPQYQLRLGFNLDSEHGALEYPAGETVRYTVTEQFGDLYHLTCLSPEAAPPFEAYFVSFTRDNHGFRNVEPWPETVDLVVLGDSFTAAEAIQRPFWQDLADSQLVLGLPGSGTLEQKRLFDAFAAPRQPQTVILAYFGGNDLSDNDFFQAHLATGRSRYDSVFHNHPPGDLLVSLHIFLYLRDALFPAPNGDCHYPTDPPTEVAFFDRFLPLLALDQETLAESESWQITRASISEMAQVLAARGARLLLLYIPQKAELYWQDLSDTSKEEIVAALREQGKNVSIEAIDRNLSAQRDLLQAFAAQAGLDSLDLTAALRAAARAGQPPYFFADTHWNQQGHNIARNALLDFLNSSTLEM